jgi:DEAD/DEAH box helicase domain-containing protein
MGALRRVRPGTRAARGAPASPPGRMRDWPPVSPDPRSPEWRLRRLLDARGRGDRVTHVEHVPARPGRRAAWPDWACPELVRRLEKAGIEAPWEHQAATAEAAWAGRSVVVATGTASGKSLGYLLPALSAVAAGTRDPGGRGATALYVAPTKALAADQLRALRALDVPGVRAATFDGDTPVDEREWVRAHAGYVLTNPDMLHRTLLPGHGKWASFLRALRYVVVDECHVYRGVFGSHVAHVLRRLRRICRRYGASPVFILASATVSAAGASAGRLVGTEVAEVTADASARGPLTFALWEPPLSTLRGEQGALVRRTALAETADLLTDLVLADVRTVAFVKSRRGTELVSLLARHALDAVAPGLGERVAAYRAGYPPEERRALERALQDGSLLGLAATTALELGVDVAGLDAVLLTGYPGTRASTWQQAGRAGRAGQGALAVLVARDDPLDTFLVHHPEFLFGQPVEATVLDPDNPYVLAPHLCAAAAEVPLAERDLPLFGPAAEDLLPDLVTRGLLRRRPAGWFWTRRDRACDLADIRGVGGSPVRVVEEPTGTVLGTVDPGAAHATVHAGAVYLHQGRTYLVNTFEVDEDVALVRAASPDYTTTARDVTDIRILETTRSESWGPGARLHFGSVEVTNQVVSFQRKRVVTGEILGDDPLDLPPRQLRTRAVWWTVSPGLVTAAGIHTADLPGAAHAAEHASIGLLPLFAACDRWDIGGVSTAFHADTALPTVFVYDGHPGGAGFAERAFEAARDWLGATRSAVGSCACPAGCPSCIQSPKCGNGNNPLDKSGAVRLLDILLRDSDPS